MPTGARGSWGLAKVPGHPIPSQSMNTATIAAVVVVAGGVGACTRGPSGGSSTAAGSALSAPWFTEQAQMAGLDFMHVNGATGRFLDAEIFAPGVALFDYDNDGDLDVFVVQGQMLEGKADPALKGRLFRNDLQVRADWSRALRFVDVTDASGIRTVGYGMGVAAADFDNDGWTDLYVTNLGTNQLFHNNGNGTFTDVSRRSGTDLGGWSVSASFFDFDRDGWLDLFVGNYLAWSVAADVSCPAVSGAPDYCAPQVYRPQQGRLFRNQGNGTFRDVTMSTIGTEYGPALGSITADLDGDGWFDLYVANDGQENQLWINQRNGRFRNQALLAGVALNGTGKAEASMGIDAGDFDNDGDEDIVITNQTAEGITLYVNNGSGVFDDWGTKSGLRQASLSYTGFGVAWLDFDNDGWLDLLTVNGEVRRNRGQPHAGNPYAQHPQLFRNTGKGRFEDITVQAGPALASMQVGRGAAFGDIDNDGDVDVVVGNNNGPLQLLINERGNRNHWLGLRLVGAAAPRDMLGARVAVVRRQGGTLWRRARADGSYASANDPRVLVGLGTSTELSHVDVTWPSGRTEQFTSAQVDRWNVLKEGTGQ